AVAQLKDRTLVIRKDVAFEGDARIATKSHPVAAFDDQRGLLFASDGDCDGMLYDLGYSEPVLTSEARCDLADSVAIRPDALELRSSKGKFLSPLPAVYVSP